MASYQIVRERPQPGFLQGLGEGIPQGADAFIKTLLPQILKTQATEKKTEQTDAYIDALKESGLSLESATVGEGGKVSRKFAKPEPTFESSAKQAVAGEISYEDLSKMFPTKAEDVAGIESQFTPVSKAEDFVPGTGTPFSNIKSFFSGSQAEIPDQTQVVIDNIKNKADLDELRMNAKEYETAGVDVKAILEYFGVK